MNNLIQTSQLKFPALDGPSSVTWRRWCPPAQNVLRNRFHKAVRFFLGTGLFFLAAWGNLRAQTWAPVGSTCFSPGASHQQSIVACNGKPYVAFDDKGSSPSGLSVMTYNGSNWVFVGKPGFGNMTPASSNTATGYPTLALDPATCQPYVSFLDRSTSITTVETYTSGAWVTLGTVDAAVDTGPSLVVYNGTPYLSFGSGGAEYVKQWNGSNWVTVGSPIPVSNSSTQTSLVVDPATGTLYLTYGSGTSPVLRYDGTSWVQVGSPVSSGSLGPQALKIDNGVPYLVYSTSNRVYVQMFNGTNWVTVGGGSVSSDDTEWPSMAFCCHNPVVSVDDETALNVGIFEYENGSWINAGAFPQGSGDVEHTSLWIDPNCNAYVAYMDANCSNKTTVMHSPIPLACLSTPSTTATTTSTPTQTATASLSPTATSTATRTATSTATPSFTASFTSTRTPTLTPANTATSTATSTSTASFTATSSSTATSSFTPTASWTPTASFTSTGTPTASPTPTPTASFTASSTATASSTQTASFTVTSTFTATSTATSTPTPTLSLTPTASGTPTSFPTETSTSTAVPTATSGVTQIPTFTSTSTFTALPTSTATWSFTPTSSATATSTFSSTATWTATSTATNSPTPTWTRSSTPSFTATSTRTPTATSTSTLTATSTGTKTPTATSTNSWTATPPSFVSFGKTASKNTAGSGDVVTYTLAVTVSGSGAAGIRVVDSLPAQETFAGFGSSPPGTQASSDPAHTVLSWTLPSPLAPGIYDLTYQAKVGDWLSTGTVLHNQAQLTVNGASPETAAADVVVTGSFTLKVGVYNEAGELIKQIAILQVSQAVNSLDWPSGTTLTQLNQTLSFYDQGHLIGKWDGTASDGNPVSNGVYHLQVTTADSLGVVNTITQPITVTRVLSLLSAGIYNEAGEVVRHLYSALSDASSASPFNVQLSGSLLNPQGPAAGGTPPSTITITLGSGTTLVWDGRGDNGSPVSNGQYYLEVHTSDGPGNETQVRQITVVGSASAGIFYAQPNRLTAGQTVATFKVSTPGAFTLRARVYDLAGQLVTLLQGAEGTSQVDWNAAGVASGIYLAELEARDAGGKLTGKQVVKVLVIR